MANTRPSSIAGTWYPGDPQVLADTYLHEVEPTQIDGEIIGIITPHAGHRYSGSVAAHAFRHLEGLEPEIVIVLSPLHSSHAAKVLTSAHTAYATPLGSIKVDEEKLGSIEEGKLADMIILSNDILSIPVEEIPQTEVLKTIVNGKIVYKKRN